jgi:co-chaperonin GroES (HSP10)
MTFGAAGIHAAVKEGDKVLLPEYGGTNLKLDGEECVFLPRLQTT